VANKNSLIKFYRHSVMSLRFKTFKGGVHPPEQKKITEGIPFEKMPSPRTIILPLSQHLGKQAVPLVKKGNPVKAGMVIAAGDGFISAPIHSSISGTVAAITKEVNSGGLPKESVIINNNDDPDFEKFPPLNLLTVTPEEIISRVKEAGIVGQGGAAFPTYVKLSPPKDKPINIVILNGCECEPYLTRDYRFMVERPEAVLNGLKLIMKAMGVGKGAVGIEDNKPEAISIMKKAAESDKNISIIPLKTKYPQGAEKMLVKGITGKEIPPGKLPFDVGAAIQNIGTAAAVFDAVVNGEPSITAAVTVTGKGINNPKNLIIPIGTTIRDVIDYCGGISDTAARIVVGGPMMGVAQYDLSAPVMKATSGILILTSDEIIKAEETSCLKCGQCADACPLNLLPTRIVRFVQLGKYEEADKMGITACMECGTCAFTCPAHIPLVQWLRVGKQKAFKLLAERSASN
jgi:Na+-translocating ferredoxin:NAD+ oxidoreductase subunit C